MQMKKYNFGAQFHKCLRHKITQTTPFQDPDISYPYSKTLAIVLYSLICNSKFSETLQITSFQF
jgi:hypothetical protein